MKQMFKRKRLGARAITTILPCLLILLPVGFAFYYVRLFGVNIVFWDEWGTVSLFEKFHSGTLGLSDLFAQSTIHISFFPKVVILFMGIVTSYNTVIQMYLILLCLCIALAVIFLTFRNSTSHSPYSLFLFVPIAFLMLSPIQHYNFLMGFQINFAFTLVFAVLAFYMLGGTGGRRLQKAAFPGALASATVASFSTIQGLLVWPVGLLPLLLTRTRNPRGNLLVATWALLGLLEYVFYSPEFLSPTATERSYPSS